MNFDVFCLQLLSIKRIAFLLQFSRSPCFFFQVFIFLRKIASLNSFMVSTPQHYKVNVLISIGFILLCWETAADTKSAEIAETIRSHFRWSFTVHYQKFDELYFLWLADYNGSAWAADGHLSSKLLSQSSNRLPVIC